MKVAIIGCGVMGYNHLRAYSKIEGVEIVGIADIDKERVELLARQFNTKAYINYHDLLEKDIDIINVVVPTTLHRQVSLDVLDANCNVLIEKPIADNLENAWQIVEKAKRKNLQLMVGHIERFNPAVARLKEILQEGILGEIASISARRVGPYTPRSYDVGVILDLGTHDIDIISYLYEERVREVYAIAGKELHKFEDHASMMLRFNNGNAGVIETNWLTPHKVRKLSVVGIQGVASLDFMEQKVILYDKEWAREAKVEKKEPLTRELEHFVEVVQNGTEPLVSGEDSIHALTVALSAIKSYTTGKVIKVKDESIEEQVNERMKMSANISTDASVSVV